jgi:hypothetical protein
LEHHRNDLFRHFGIKTILGRWIKLFNFPETVKITRVEKIYYENIFGNLGYLFTCVAKTSLTASEVARFSDPFKPPEMGR